MNDRIKLAEAMGMGPDEYNTSPIFDPFTSADDDYAVLEWARENDDDLIWLKFSNQLNADLYGCPENYRIGCNARSALKVIE